jgi:hypothetical protein
MIKVTHTKTLDGSTEQSEFSTLEAWEQHPYYNNPNFTNVVEEKQDALITRDQELEACNAVIKLVGFFNKSKPEGAVLASLQNPQMQSVIMALLTGAPKTAKAAISMVDKSIYDQKEIDEVNSILDRVIS